VYTKAIIVIDEKIFVIWGEYEKSLMKKFLSFGVCMIQIKVVHYHEHDDLRTNIKIIPSE
jgi:hypothetical protein